ncbi:MAG: RNA polymerase sigma factor [Deinococcales bacterium]
MRFTPQKSLSALEDAELVALSRRGEEEAFDELVRRHSPRLHAVASRIVGREEAYDVIQDAFLAAYRAIATFRQEAQFSTWLHRIALNCCYARLRKHPESTADLEPPEISDTRSASPVLVSERQDLRAALEKALGQLKPEFRETFVLVEFGNLDYAATASVLGIEVGTVKSRMNRARAALRQILEKWGYAP